MYKPFWALLFLLSCTYSAAFADDPTSESKGWGGAPAPSENECRSFIEAALKEQRSQVEAGGGDAAEEASAIGQEEQIDAVDQVIEETTADASIENIENPDSSDAVGETNERVEISETEPEEPETPIEQEEAVTKSAEETPAESAEVEEAPAESSEAEPEEVITESTEAGEVQWESLETEGVPAESTEAEPEKAATESTEAEGVPAESAEAETEEAGTESVEGEGALSESAEAEPEEAVTQSNEVEETPAEAVGDLTGSAEGDDSGLAATASAEAEETESTEELQSEITGKEVDEQLERELAESVEGESEHATEEAASTEEIVKEELEGAAEDVVPESTETESQPEEPLSDEENILADQPVEAEVSGEAAASNEQEVESEQVEEQPESSTEQEETVSEQSEVQELEPEEIAVVSQETSEDLNAPNTEELEMTGTQPTESEAKLVEEQIIEVEPINEPAESSEDPQTEEGLEGTENVEPSSIDTTEGQELSSETTSEAITEELPVTETEDLSPTKAEESPASDAVIEETPAESASSVEQESATEPQTEEVSEPQAEADAVAVDVGMEEEIPEQEDLTLKIEIPENLRSRNHITEVLRIDIASVDTEAKLLKAEESTLKELKRVYEAAIKPLEILYKYRDLSNRHFGDPEIFSKPLILFMGPWSGGKSTIINYLLDNEYKNTALRTGAEPSPAYFNIVMKGEREEIMDGTQLAADWTFSGLQKFGQGLLDRLRGLRLNSPLLEKVNIVEIPGILEIRKQVERLFPLNDACQWFIDRADIIFLVYDPSKLDVGPETEAILDQLKGREYQTKIILNKADQVKPEELMRVQGTLIWNISPLMSSTEPPVMYSTSLWSHPYQPGSPSRLLFAQEKAFLKDLREAMEKRVENKISSARRFAVRVRNHAKMVDCYLTTYYNHKTFFGNKQKVSDDIIEHPQNYHIYEGLSTLTNISRYDLPDPDVYRDFFRLNPVYDFQQLASTCTYFKGCPINRLDVAIAYDLPELVGRYKKVAEDVKSQGKK